MNNTTAETEKARDRYPGLKPFIVGDKAIFFGRETETESILQSISVNKAFIVWGKSGLGKSSLINAAVIPKLVEQNYLPLRIRFYNCKEDPLKIIETEIMNHIANPAEVTAGGGHDLETLVKALPEGKKLIFIFDQFEEFFYYPPAKREQTLNAIAGLINSNVYVDPADAASLQQARLSNGLESATIKLLFLIRSDRLNMMDEVSVKIPGIFNNRYQLKPLVKEKAEQSLELPAQIADTDINNAIFKIAPFEYSDAALRVILQTLSGANNEIESSQLQIVCQEFESIADELFAKKEERLLEPEDFKGEAGIKEILNGFYFKQIQKLKDDTEFELSEEDILKIKRLIENDLVSGRKRIIQSAERVRDNMECVKPGVAVIGNKDKVDAILDRLLDLRLIREEESHLGKVYEISHDTLLESIIRSRDERVRREKDEKIKEQQRQLVEANKKSEAERKLKEKALQEREKARAAEKEAKEAKELAMKGEKEAADARKKSSRYFKLTMLFLVVMVLLAVGLFISQRVTNKERNRYYDALGQVLAYNSTEAYQDFDHALAFDLALYTDDLQKQQGRLADSLMRQWSLAEYSGDKLQVSKDESVVACHYRDNSVQLFNFLDPVRKNNHGVVMDSVDYFNLATDGSAIVTVDTTIKMISLHSITKIGTDSLTLKTIWKNSLQWPSSADDCTLLIKNDSVAILRPDSIIFYTAHEKKALRFTATSKKSFAEYYWTGDKIYIQNDYNDNNRLFEIDLQNNSWALRTDFRLIPGSSGNAFLFNEKDRSLTAIADGKPFISNFPRYFTPEEVITTSQYFIIKDGDNYLFFLKGNGEQPFVYKNNMLMHELGAWVQYADDTPMFIENDTLAVMTAMDTFKKSAITTTKGKSHEDAFEKKYFLSADRSKIYYCSVFDVIGVIPLSGPMLLHQVHYTNNAQDFDRQKTRRYDFFLSRNRLEKIDTVKKDLQYWKDFYEPLTKRNKISYGIPE